MNLLLTVIWFFLPAGIANVAPIIVAKIPFLKNYSYPLDGYKKWKGKRIFGDHKTVRGIVAGILMGVLTQYLLEYFYHSSNVSNYLNIDYSNVNSFILGFLLGFGALAGDAAKSFFKRQKEIPDGKKWIPFDQIDYILGGCVLASLYIRLTAFEYIILFLIWIGMHFLFSYIGYLLKFKKDPV